MLRRLCAASLLVLAIAPARAANLDVTAGYRMKAVSYSNLNLTGDKPFQYNHSFISNDARLGIAVRKIELEPRGGDMTTMDVGITLRALGASGSTSTVRAAPFDRVAANYPSADFTPFIEQAYVRVNRFLGYPLEATFGRQNYRLGSGLLLDDDGAGLTGITVRGDLPWWGMKAEGFVFSDRDSRRAAQGGEDNSLALFGFAVDLPSEGVWQLNQLFERDRAQQQIYGCSYANAAGGAQPPSYACYASRTLKSFSSLRYTLSYGPIVFDGEAAYQRGTASPINHPGDTALNGTLNRPPGRITYNANAQVVKAKWKQSLPRLGEGIARVSVARGSGDDAATTTRDEAFYPAHGHQFDGLDRSGFGSFFNATPYSAFGGNYGSTTTASGLQEGSSGIMVVGVGYTPPAYKGVIFDADFYLFQTERATRGVHTLGTEWDLRLRYNVQDRFGISVSTAFFKSGKATLGNGASAKKYALEAFGRF
ncbi:MAG: hypothetical protein HY926_03050 [Elusimicrobia bacterium]|nr:hypothetical protein [Elusimicrobiota bacterium]